MGWKEHEKQMAQTPEGRDAIEADKRLTAERDKRENDISSYETWLTGLSSAQLIFILTNLNETFIDKGWVLSVISSLLILCVFFGLLYHFVKVNFRTNKMSLYASELQ